MSEQSSKLVYGGAMTGMTDTQFKAYLMEQLEHWQRVYDLAVAHSNEEIRLEAEKQIAKFNAVLKF